MQIVPDDFVNPTQPKNWSQKGSQAPPKNNKFHEKSQDYKYMWYFKM